MATTNPLFFECPEESCCDQVNGCQLEFTCTGNTTGPLCSLCVNEDESRWSSECFACDTINVSYIVATLIGIFLFVLYSTFLSTGENMLLANAIFTYQVVTFCFNILDHDPYLDRSRDQNFSPRIHESRAASSLQTVWLPRSRSMSCSNDWNRQGHAKPVIYRSIYDFILGDLLH